MLRFNQWFSNKAREFGDNTYLIDSNRHVTYAENYQEVQKLAGRLAQGSVKKHDNVVFIGTGTIQSYQLYFAVLANQATWIPVSYMFDQAKLLDILNMIQPDTIFYDDELIDMTFLKQPMRGKLIRIKSVFEFSSYQVNDNVLINTTDTPTISYYLTSGSTDLPKLVTHSWEATLQHADATVKRYPFTRESRLFNPRHIYHVSGAFALTTLMHCGGSIVIPNTASHNKPENARITEWSHMMRFYSVTHASFFPTEMQLYAEIIDKTPALNPGSLKRITTGGEGIEFALLVKVSRAFAANRLLYDCLWMLFPFLGEGKLFTFSKAVYEYLYGNLVQVTQTYGATELICNAVANSAMTGPDPRGIGTALNSIHPEIIDDAGFPLPQDGKAIGRLRLYGASIASGYAYTSENTLTPRCYQTNDLASIQSNGRITLFGRVESKITIDGIAIIPAPIEHELCQLSSVKSAIVFGHRGMLCAAVNVATMNDKSEILHSLITSEKFSTISAVAIITKFELTLAGKIDRNATIAKITEGESLISLKEDRLKHKSIRRSFCLVL